MKPTIEVIQDILFEQYGIEKSKIKPESNFQEDLSFDSLDAVEFIMECEKRWNIAIPDDDSEKVQTVQDIVSTVDRILNEKNKL